ncbi:secreted protein [Biscogniauxia sp. FL1348]|nr:secreted protein [Biscogniauxia sp. FL1348]
MGLFTSPKALLLAIISFCAIVDAAAISRNPALVLKRAVPTKLPACATALDKKWQPAMDFDTDGCYNTPAVDAQGNTNPGLKCGGAKNGHCRDKSDLLNNNVYSRSRCNNHWCIVMYAYYFEKDQSVDGSCGVGHRHDWEHIAIWLKDDAVQYVAVSQHTGWEIRKASDVRWFQDTHAKVVYNQDGSLTHDFRFGTADDDKGVENHLKEWFLGDLVSYNGFPNVDVRKAMMDKDWGKASINIKDGNWPGRIEKAKNGKKDISLDVNKDEVAPGNRRAC